MAERPALPDGILLSSSQFSGKENVAFRPESCEPLEYLDLPDGSLHLARQALQPSRVPPVHGRSRASALIYLTGADEPWEVEIRPPVVAFPHLRELLENKMAQAHKTVSSSDIPDCLGKFLWSNRYQERRGRKSGETETQAELRLPSLRTHGFF